MSIPPRDPRFAVLDRPLGSPIPDADGNGHAGPAIAGRIENHEAFSEPMIFSPSDPLPTAMEFLHRLYGHVECPMLHFSDSVFHAWDGIRYAELEPDAARSKIYAFLEKAKKWTGRGEQKVLAPFAPNSTSVANVIDALKAIAFTPKQMPCWITENTNNPDPLEILAMRNALVSLTPDGARIIGEPTPLWFSANAVEYDFNPHAPTPNEWMAFLNSLWPDDPASIKTLQEWFGYVLTLDTRQQKALLLLGPPRSGKGTIARILTSVIGAANVCAPTLAGLATNFGLWALIGKQLGIIADARLSGRTDQAVVTERLLSITGEDSLTIDRKNMQPITVRLPTRLMLLTNELPRLNDASGALSNRFIVLSLTQSFLGREDHGLEDRLKAELPSILNWGIAGWQRLRERGRFVQPESSQAIINELGELASPISGFIAEWCAVRRGLTVPAAELYAGWCAWCKEQGRDSAGTLQSFGRDVRAVLPCIKVVSRRDGEDRRRSYEGIDLTEAAKMSVAKWNVVRDGTRTYPLHV